MAPSAQTPAARQRIDPQVWARRIRRGTIAFAVIVLIVGFAVFGTRWVPAHMNTVPEVPAGSYCILDKRVSAAQVGSHVFVETPAGDVILSRVSARDERTITVMHPNSTSLVPDSRVFGALPHRAIRGTVLCVFPPESESGGLGGK